MSTEPSVETVDDDDLAVQQIAELARESFRPSPSDNSRLGR